MCLELSVIRNIRPSMPCCTDSTGTPSFPANINHEFRTFNVETECSVSRDIDWNCLDLFKPDSLIPNAWLRSKHLLQPLKHTLLSCSGTLLLYPTLCLLVTFENPTEACSFAATGTFVAKWPLCVLLVLAVIHYCFQEVSVNLSGVYWLLRFLLAAPSYILVLVPLFSNSSAIRPNSATTVNLRKKTQVCLKTCV